jgi:probable phosphoglycerate mutase
VTYRAVIFDLGGVIFPSPFDAIRAYEREIGLEPGFLGALISGQGHDGAWSAQERGEIDPGEFATAFALECRAADAPVEVDGAAFMEAIGSGGGARPEMLAAVDALRAGGLGTGALTNNWKALEGEGPAIGELIAHFDVVVESAVVGMRKPTPGSTAWSVNGSPWTCPRRCSSTTSGSTSSRPGPSAWRRSRSTIPTPPWRSSPSSWASTWPAPPRQADAMELILIRHAEPERIASGEGGPGPVDPALTERGHDQAARLAAWFAGDAIDAVISSPLRRAVDTAAPLAAALQLEPIVVAGLVEYDAGADHYIPVEELRATRDSRWDAMVAGRWEEFGGENPHAFRARLVPEFDAIVETHPGCRVAVVCHGGVINVYLAAVLGLDAHLWFEPVYTSVSRVLASGAGHRSLRTLNETAHLDGRRDQ